MRLITMVLYFNLSYLCTGSVCLTLCSLLVYVYCVFHYLLSALLTPGKRNIAANLGIVFSAP